MDGTSRSSSGSTASTASANSLAARETFQTLLELSRLLNTGLDAETLAICVRLCENGVRPDALAKVILQLRENKHDRNDNTNEIPK